MIGAMGTIESAEREFKAANTEPKIREVVSSLLKGFVDQGHSGASAAATIAAFEHLAPKMLDGVLVKMSDQEVFDLVEELANIYAARKVTKAEALEVVRVFCLLARHRPLVPLTGESFEWQEVGFGLLQNVRCPRVFKGKGEFDRAYDIEAIVFREPSGATFITGRPLPGYPNGSKVFISFPYEPKTSIVDVDGGV